MQHFHLHAVSGLIATSAAAGVLFAWHNPSSTRKQYIQRVRATALVTTLPSAAQEFSIEMARAVFASASGDYTDGQNLSDPATAANYAIRNRNLDLQKVTALGQIPVSILDSGNVRIASTAALTAGASPPTIDAHGWAWDGIVAVVAAATIVGPTIYMDWVNPSQGLHHESPEIGCLPRSTDEGFVIRTPIAIANSLVTRLAVEVEWLE